MARTYITLPAAVVGFVCRQKRVTLMESRSQIPCLGNVKCHAYRKKKSTSILNEL